jgi:hypothetical protein
MKPLHARSSAVVLVRMFPIDCGFAGFTDWIVTPDVVTPIVGAAKRFDHRVGQQTGFVRPTAREGANLPDFEVSQRNAPKFIHRKLMLQTARHALWIGDLEGICGKRQ